MGQLYDAGTNVWTRSSNSSSNAYNVNNASGGLNNNNVTNSNRVAPAFKEMQGLRTL
jgi:hypothetical protein